MFLPTLAQRLWTKPAFTPTSMSANPKLGLSMSFRLAILWGALFMIAGQSAQAADGRTTRTLGVCFLAPNEPSLYTSENGLGPKVDARNYLWQFDHRDIDEDVPATITILETPKHGVLRPLTEADRGTFFAESSGPLPADPGYLYLPKSGYLGKDKAAFLVQIAGVKVKVIYFLQGIDTPVGDTERLCKRGYSWKISSTHHFNDWS